MSLPKTREIEEPCCETVRKMTKNCETHDRTVRVGRCASVLATKMPMSTPSVMMSTPSVMMNFVQF